MFQGRSGLALDAKGRMSVPARHRDALTLQCEGRLTLTISALPIGASAWKRFFLGNAIDVELDGSGRVLIAPELRQVAGLDRDIVLLGMGTHFEVWDASRLAAKEDEAIAGGIPEALSGLSI